MKQYQQPAVKPTVTAPIQSTVPTLTEQQLIALVNRLNAITEQQSRQIRRLENDIIIIRESINYGKK